MVNKVLSKTMMPIFTAATLAVLSACGDDVTEVTQVVGMQVVEEGEALPKCSAENEGAMVYSVDSAAAYYCVNKTWTSMKGKDGKDGADGKDGKDGENGTDGSSASSCTAVAIDNGYKIVCGKDSVGVVLNGKDGAKGDSGVAGASCSAKEVSDGVEITCTDGKSFTLKNGADGKDGKSFIEGVMIDPRDKQIYRVVTIGEQTWMAENLNYATAEGSYCYGETASNPKTENCTKYGRLYTWMAAKDVCPKGWHLPDTTELNKLLTAVGGKNVAGEILKSQTGWHDFEGKGGNGTDAYGFSGFPAGQMYDNGGFFDEGFSAYFWSTERESYHAYSLLLDYVGENALVGIHPKDYAFSVRCLKDDP